MPSATNFLALAAICSLAKVPEILPKDVCMHKSVSREVGHW